MTIEQRVRNSSDKNKVLATARNKIRKINKELNRNPTNYVAKKSLEFWELLV